MRQSRFVIPILLGLCMAAFADDGFEAPALAQQMQTPAVPPGMARVWFLRQASPVNGNVWASVPEIYANGAAIGDIPAGSKFYRDFRPGTYGFTVQPYGLPTGQADTVQLAPGTQTYLEVQWIASWEAGYPEAGFGFGSNTFGIMTMSPQLAQADLPSLTYHPQ